jgi:ferredoxin-NADP reductase
LIDLDFTVFQWGGLLLIALLVLQLLIGLVKQVLQLRLDRKWQKLTHKQLKLAESSILQKHEDTEHSWLGLRKFRIESKVKECEDVYSFYLTPHDKQPIPSYKPGQHLTVSLKPHNQKKLVRCYSLSDSPGSENIYVITVKKLTEPEGKASSLLHEDYSIGDLIDIKAPKGGFFLNKKSQKPVILLANGVGITPLLAMLNYLYEKQADREVHLFYGVRNTQHFIKKDEIKMMQDKHPLFSLHLFYSQPSDSDVQGEDYDHVGYVNSERVLQIICDTYSFQDIEHLHDFEYYICGTSDMMNEMLNGLRAWQIPEESINYEAFGPSSIQKSTTSQTQSPDSDISIEFKRSGKVLKWGGESSLLELSQNSQVPVDCGCCFGECGTCEIAIISGDVDYPHRKPETDVKEGHCLMCIAVPKGPIVLDA